MIFGYAVLVQAAQRAEKQRAARKTDKNQDLEVHPLLQAWWPNWMSEPDPVPVFDEEGPAPDSASQVISSLAATRASLRRRNESFENTVAQTGPAQAWAKVDDETRPAPVAWAETKQGKLKGRRSTAKAGDAEAVDELAWDDWQPSTDVGLSDSTLELRTWQEDEC